MTALARERPAAQGVALVLVSAAGFAALVILAQLAYRSDVSVLGLVSGRFVLAAGLLWLLVALFGKPLPSGRHVRLALALGVLYGANAALLAGSFERLDAGLADLLFFVNPVLITAGAVAIGRDRWSGRRGVALAVAGVGVSLTLVAGGAGVVDPVGAALALAAAAVYAGFVLSSSSLLTATSPLVLAALTASGAAAAMTGAALASGDAGPQGGAPGVLLVAAVALVGNVVALGALLAGVARLGPSRASIVGSVEPVFCALLGLAAFGDRMEPPQLLGAALVIVSIPILELRPRSRRRRPRRSFSACPSPC